MASWAKRLVLYLICLLVFLISALGVLVYLESRPPDPQSPEQVEKYIHEFIAEFAQSLAPDEGVRPRETSGPVDGWILHTLSRINSGWEPGTGAGGLLAIGRVVDGGWKTRLIGSEGFEEWLQELPKDILTKEQKEAFMLFRDLEKGPQVSSTWSDQPSVAVYQDLPVFNLPYPEGKSYQITTTPNDHYHKGILENAIDFGMPTGAKVLSITDGRVVEVKEDSNSGGCNTSFANNANFVRVQLDGVNNVQVLYLHLEAGSVQVQEGQKVSIGQELARVGETGFTCGPHLHIVLEKICSDGRVCGSIQLNFEEFKGKKPQYTTEYTSDNKSPEKRKQIEEEERQKQFEAEAEEIKAAVKSFLPVYACSTLKKCNEADLITTSVTDGLLKELFPSLSFCFSCESWDSNIQQSIEFLPFTYTGGSCFTKTNEKCFTVTTKQIWISETSTGRVSRHGEITHYTVVDYFLVRETGIWKVDGQKLICGYTADQNGKMIPEEETVEEENLDGCLWQPPEENEESTSESTP